jgi:hypothetical protein
MAPRSYLFPALRVFRGSLRLTRALSWGDLSARQRLCLKNLFVAEGWLQVGLFPFASGASVLVFFAMSLIINHN